VFYTVTYDGFRDVEAKTPAAARKEVQFDIEDQDLVYEAEREDLKINDVQDPDGGSYSPEEWVEGLVVED
jgi:hypothetical protein